MRRLNRSQQKGSVLLRFLLIVVLVVLVGGVAFLATSEIPAPLQPVEKIVPNDRFDS